MKNKTWVGNVWCGVVWWVGRSVLWYSGEGRGGEWRGVEGREGRGGEGKGRKVLDGEDFARQEVGELGK